MTTDSKLSTLRNTFREMERVVIAFSGGVDSSYLLSVAVDELGDRALGVTALSPTFAASEEGDAREVARFLGARHELFDTDQLEMPDFVENDGRRCYFCRVDMFSKLREIADAHQIHWLVDGTLLDDLDDVRPGLKARDEEGVRSPFVEAGMTKNEVRALARERCLPNWDKPSESCLASRIPLGVPVSFELLGQIARAEAVLHEFGFRQVRVRHHGAIARIEVGQDEIARLLDSTVRDTVSKGIRDAGYGFVTVDLAGYRTGSLNTRAATPGVPLRS